MVQFIEPVEHRTLTPEEVHAKRVPEVDPDVENCVNFEVWRAISTAS
jgi:hypothetical protein